MQSRRMHLDFLLMGSVCLGTALGAGRILSAAGTHIGARVLLGAAICYAFTAVWSWRWGAHAQ